MLPTVAELRLRGIQNKFSGIDRYKRIVYQHVEDMANQMIRNYDRDEWTFQWIFFRTLFEYLQYNWKDLEKYLGPIFKEKGYDLEINWIEDIRNVEEPYECYSLTVTIGE